MPQSVKKRKPNNKDVTKKLQTELQATIAYGCYDSNQVLRSGKSCRKDDLVTKINQLYMPKTDDEDNLSHVEMFLEGKGKYTYLFDTIPCPNNSGEQIKIIPEVMHSMEGKSITLSPGCIDKSLLTRKNLSNFIDISPNTLYRHAKEVEANCKKALAICTAEGSPYRNYDGHFPSGTNREDYLVWLRKEMNSTIDTVDIDEDDLDEVATESDRNNNTENAVDEDDNNDGGSDNSSKKKVSDDYFKGYFAFALWGYIPPDGGEEYKTSFIETVVKRDMKVKVERGVKMEKEIEERSLILVPYTVMIGEYFSLSSKWIGE